MYKTFIKRFLDICAAAFGLVVLAVPMAVIAFAVKADSEGPALFWQKRVGLRDKTFMMPKFRTMYKDAPSEVPTHLLADAESRITHIGKFLRESSIDELPQLWSVFAGDMSLVGPRPALWNQYDLLACRKKYGADTVRPGITGWAQINGRDELSIEEKAYFDGEYVRKMSFAFDCKCLLLTVVRVLRHEGIVEGAQPTKKE